MRVLALTECPNHVCYRYRIEAHAPALAERGWTLESLPMVHSASERSKQLQEAANYDLVILQRKLLPLWQIRLLRKLSRVLVYDFDDAQFHRDSYSRKTSASWTRLAHFWATIYAADAVLAGNSYLRDQAASYIEPSRAHLMPTCVDPDLYPLAVHDRAPREPRMVWIGQHATLPCLYRAQHLLAAATRRVPGLALHVISNQFPTLEGVRVVPCSWSMAGEAARVAEADIGVSWLPDDSWSLGKCGLKVLQYMAAGLPVVANAVGMNREMVRHGETGFLANTTREWADCIERLCDDADLRQRMGQAGRRLVEEHYSTRRWGPRFAELVDELGRGASKPVTPANDRLRAAWRAIEARGSRD